MSADKYQNAPGVKPFYENLGGLTGELGRIASGIFNSSFKDQFKEEYARDNGVDPFVSALSVSKAEEEAFTDPNKLGSKKSTFSKNVDKLKQAVSDASSDILNKFSGVSSAAPSSAPSSAPSGAPSGAGVAAGAANAVDPVYGQFNDGFNFARANGMDDAIAYQEYLSNTAVQRQAADMKAAGINPALLAGGGGSSVFAVDQEPVASSGSGVANKGTAIGSIAGLATSLLFKGSSAKNVERFVNNLVEKVPLLSAAESLLSK